MEASSLKNSYVFSIFLYFRSELAKPENQKFLALNFLALKD